MGMTFEEVRRANRKRAETPVSENGFGHAPGLVDWTLAEWTNAIAGEVGELCNLTKKIRRSVFEKDSEITKEEIMEEVGGAFAYLDLFCTRYGVTLEDCIRYEFNRVSKKIGYDGRL